MTKTKHLTSFERSEAVAVVIIPYPDSPIPPRCDQPTTRCVEGQGCDSSVSMCFIEFKHEVSTLEVPYFYNLNNIFIRSYIFIRSHKKKLILKSICLQQ